MAFLPLGVRVRSLWIPVVRQESVLFRGGIEAPDRPLDDHPDDDPERYGILLALPQLGEQPDEDSLRDLVGRVPITQTEKARSRTGWK
jgi:hypothetical protein